LKRSGAIFTANEHREQALVGGELLEMRADSTFGLIFEQRNDSILDGPGHQFGAKLDIAAKPFGEDAIDVRYGKISRPDEQRDQRDAEPQTQPTPTHA
jgi:hypothetical protein